MAVLTVLTAPVEYVEKQRKTRRDTGQNSFDRSDRGRSGVGSKSGSGQDCFDRISLPPSVAERFRGPISYNSRLRLNCSAEPFDTRNMNVRERDCGAGST